MQLRLRPSLCRSDLLRLILGSFDRLRNGSFLFLLCLFTSHIPVVDKPCSLYCLRGGVGRVTCEQEVIARLDTPCWNIVRGECLIVEKSNYVDSPNRMKTNL